MHVNFLLFVLHHWNFVHGHVHAGTDVTSSLISTHFVVFFGPFFQTFCYVWTCFMETNKLILVENLIFLFIKIKFKSFSFTIFFVYYFVIFNSELVLNQREIFPWVIHHSLNVTFPIEKEKQWSLFSTKNCLLLWITIFEKFLQILSYFLIDWKIIIFNLKNRSNTDSTESFIEILWNLFCNLFFILIFV